MGVYFWSANSVFHMRLHKKRLMYGGIEDILSTFKIPFYSALNEIYHTIKSKYRTINENCRAINGKLVGSHVIGCHARCFRRWQSSCHCWRCMFWGQWSVLFSWKIIDQYFAVHLRHIALWISAVNLDFAKFYETLSEMAVSENKWGSLI